VYTQSGPRPIQTLFENKKLSPKILTVNKDNKLVFKKIKSVWSTGEQEVFELICENGYRIQLTKNHQVYTQDGFVDLKNIKIDDFIVIPKQYKYNGADTVNEEEAILISYIISDGYHVKYQTKITNSDEWILSKIRNACKNNNIETKEYYHKNGCVDIFIKGEYKKFLDKILEHKKSRYKKIPSLIYSSTSGITKAFIGHYFSAEGSISNCNIDFCSTSKEILFTLQALLLRDGIHSSFYIKNTKYKNKPYISYKLCVCGNYYLNRFLNTYIDHICPKKVKKIKDLLLKPIKYNNSRFLVPSCFIKAATKDKNLNCVLADPSGSCYNKNQTYDRAKRINQILDSDVLGRVLDSDFLYSKVVKIERKGIIETYDYEIEDENIHYGFINGILVHNSIGKKKADIMQGLEKDFVNGCSIKGLVNEKEAEQIFGWIKESQRYSFNKSHAIGYGKTAYWTAYLKSHFPLQFYCSWLNGAKWKQEPLEEIYAIVNDAKLYGVNICVPNLQDNRPIPYIKNRSVYFGLGDIKAIGSSSLKQIAHTIEKYPDKVHTWIDFILYISTKISVTTSEALISCGAMDYMCESRSKMLYDLKISQLLTKKEILWMIENDDSFDTFEDALEMCARTRKEGGGCTRKNRVEKVQQFANSIKNPPHSLNDTADFISWSEIKYLGVAISCSKVDDCEGAIQANATCIDVAKGNMSGYIVLAVEVNRIKEVVTKNGKNPGQPMAFLSVSDSTCELSDVVIFPNKWSEYKQLLQEGNTVLLSCEKEKKGSLIINKVIQI